MEILCFDSLILAIVIIFRTGSRFWLDVTILGSCLECSGKIEKPPTINVSYCGDFKVFNSFLDMIWLNNNIVLIVLWSYVIDWWAGRWNRLRTQVLIIDLLKYVYSALNVIFHKNSSMRVPQSCYLWPQSLVTVTTFVSSDHLFRTSFK